MYSARYSTSVHLVLATYSSLSGSLKEEGLELIPVIRNLVDIVWAERPATPNNPVIILDSTYTGTSVFSAKIATVEVIAENRFKSSGSESFLSVNFQ